MSRPEGKEETLEKFVLDERRGGSSVIGIDERVNAEESANPSDHEHVGI